MTDEKKIDIDKLVDFIYQGIRNKNWLYWPPGPMVGQVFDKERCKKDIENFLK